MATKKVKDPLVERHKLITKIVKAVVSRNAVLPVLEDVLLSEGFITVTDLENEVSIPYPEMGDIDTCIPANRFLDCIAMMDRPQIKVVHNKEPLPIRDHFRYNEKIWEGSEQFKRGSYDRYGNPEEETFNQWLESNGRQLTEADVEQKYKEWDHVEISHGKRVIKLGYDNPDNFPVTGVREGEFKHYADLGEQEMRLIETALKFVSTDDLRPAMTGIYFDNDDIAATDAHRLFFHPFVHIPHPFILPPKAAKLLMKIGGTWSLYGNGGYKVDDEGNIVTEQPTKRVQQLVPCFYPEGFDTNEPAFNGTVEEAQASYEQRPEWMSEMTFIEWCERELSRVDAGETEWVDIPDLEQEAEPVSLEQSNVIFINQDGIMVKTSVIDARYPDYRCVIPQGEGNYVLTVNPDELLGEIRNAMKFANKSTNQVAFNLNGKASIAAQDIDLAHSYENDLELAEIEKLNGNDDLLIAFNGNFISQIVSDLPCEPVRIKMWGPTKAAIINDHYLVMPLMIKS